MKRDVIWFVGLIFLILLFVVSSRSVFVGIKEIWLSDNSNNDIEKKEAVKHERRKNVLHDDGKTTEVFSHTIRYGDTMTVEIDTFIYR